MNSCLALAVVSAAIFTFAPARAEMRGDEAARALATEMVEAMGGAAVWADARWLFTRERSFSQNHKLALDYHSWRDLQTPRGFYSVESEEISYRQAWTTAQGWRVLNGEFLAFDDERLAGETTFWPREIYVMYHRLAKRDAGLRLTSTGPRGFAVADAETGAPLGTYTISREGGPLVWSSGDADDDVTYVYGPLTDFDGIRLPAWGAQTNGGYRFDYVAAYVSEDGPDFSFDPPENDGARP